MSENETEDGGDGDDDDDTGKAFYDEVCRIGSQCCLILAGNGAETDRVQLV